VAGPDGFIALFRNPSISGRLAALCVTKFRKPNYVAVKRGVRYPIRVDERPREVGFLLGSPVDVVVRTHVCLSG
jgi:hypothetical protein